MNSYLEYVHEVIPKSSLFKKNNLFKTSVDDFRSEFYDLNDLQMQIVSESNSQVLEYISEHLDLAKYFRNILFSTRNKTYADRLDFGNLRAIINFRVLNEISHLNKHLVSVNKLLPDAGIYIGRVETYGERKNRIFRKYGNKYGKSIWLLDFIFNRIVPKLRPFCYLFNYIMKCKFRPVSKAEILGRLAFCGFEIIDYRIIDNLFYFVVIKTHEFFDEPEPSCHAFLSLSKIGKGGNAINVYKMRTMHHYSQYLQHYVVKLYEYNELGKPADDFRISRWGKLLRRHWIDELPQLLNVFRGEMKIVGVRPVTKERFLEFPKDIQEERIKYKPGCIPPYVALLRPDTVGNIEAERIYLKEYALHPIKTDVKFFFKAIANIMLYRIRSY